MTCCFRCSPLPCSRRPHPRGDRCIHCDAELGSSTHCGTKWSNTWLQGNLCNNLPSSKNDHLVIPPCRIVSYSTASLRLYSLTDETNYLNISSVRTTTTRTLLDETPTNLLNITERTLTRHLSLQRQYFTSRALLRPSRGYYNLTISVLLTNPLRLCDNY